MNVQIFWHYIHRTNGIHIGMCTLRCTKTIAKPDQGEQTESDTQQEHIPELPKKNQNNTQQHTHKLCIFGHLNGYCLCF